MCINTGRWEPSHSLLLFLSFSLSSFPLVLSSTPPLLYQGQPLCLTFSIPESLLCLIAPVDESVVQQEYGVVGRALHRRHGTVHEDVQGIVHGALAQHRHACFWAGKTCRMEEKVKTCRRQERFHGFSDCGLSTNPFSVTIPSDKRHIE